VVNKRKIKKILFRLDAGKTAGYGHLSRNLTLAETLLGKDYESFFLTKTDDRDGIKAFIKSYCNDDLDLKFLPYSLQVKEELQAIIEEYNNGCSFLILDHYHHDKKYQLYLKSQKVKWAQFDFKKSEQIFADILINPNLGVSSDDYRELVYSKTKLCVGEKYTIIRKEFLQTKRQPIKNRILIAMVGGSHPQEVFDMISALVKEKEFHFDIIGGGAICHELFAPLKNTSVYENPDQISKIFSKAHAAIVAGGVTAYELAYLGVPLVIVPFVENQNLNAIALERAGFGISFSGLNQFSKALTSNGIKGLQKEFPKTLRKKKFDGLGSSRITTECLKFL